MCSSASGRQCRLEDQNVLQSHRLMKTFSKGVGPNPSYSSVNMNMVWATQLPLIISEENSTKENAGPRSSSTALQEETLYVITKSKINSKFATNNFYIRTEGIDVSEESEMPIDRVKRAGTKRECKFLNKPSVQNPVFYTPSALLWCLENCQDFSDYVVVWGPKTLMFIKWRPTGM